MPLRKLYLNLTIIIAIVCAAISPTNAYQPLTCNNISSAAWNSKCSSEEAITLSDLVLLSTTSASTSPGVALEIPCGECVVVDYTDGSTIEISGGINVVGKLYFPTAANVTIRTTHVFVQGIFSTERPMGVPISTDSNRVKILIYEEETDEDSTVQLHAENMGKCDGIFDDSACRTSSMSTGRKSFSVVGGRMDVSAIDPSCPAWEHLLDYTVTSNPNPPQITGPTPGPKPQPPPGCSRTLIDINFKVGDDPPPKFGNYVTNTIHPHDVEGDTGVVGANAYASSSTRSAPHVGPAFIAPGGCALPNTTYLMSGRARLRSEDGVTPTLCSMEGGEGSRCLRMNVANRDNTPNVGSQMQSQHNFIKDGEWFEFTFSINEMSEELIGTTEIKFWLYNPEATAIIDIDWLKLELPSDDIFPEDTPEGCSDLAFGNGDAEIMNGDSTFPWVSSWAKNYLYIESETMPDGSTNRFYRQLRIENNWGMWYKKHGFNTPCIVSGEEYVLKVKVRVLSDVEQRVDFRFGYKNPSGEWQYLYLNSSEGAYLCPNSSNALGWVECSLRMTATDEMVGSSGYQLWSYINDGVAPISTIDYDDISFSRFDPESSVHKIYASTEAATCWAKGSELLLTSSTYDQEDEHRVTVLDTDPVAGTITIDQRIPFTTTKADDEQFPVEVVNLSRNFILEAEEDQNNALHGGHFIIIHTPDIQQLIEGIEIINFGQQGHLGRYPIHFHMCNSVEGSIVSKNVIKHSNQRGIVIHGTNNVTISDNVIYDIKGHGYFLEDGAEQYNRFYRNLATKIYPVMTLVDSDETETDKQASAFWISNTMNYFEGNVIAGGCCHGYWFEPQFGNIRGASQHLEENKGIDRTKLNLLQFENNDVHSVSNFGMRLYPNKWNPDQQAQIVNLRTYRNGNVGISLHVDTNVRLLGGFYGDNGFRQIWSSLADDITIEGAHVVGISLKFRKALQRANRSPRCKNLSLVGVSFSTRKLFHFSSEGMRLKNVQFSDFDCGSNNYAIHAGDEQGRNGDLVYDAITKLDGGIAFNNVPVKMSACIVESQGVVSVAFEDVSGVLNPNGSFTPGFIVSNNVLVTSLAGGSCQDLEENTCLSYCEDTCLQTITVTIDSTPDIYEMVLTNVSNTEFTVLIPEDNDSRIRFGASLPGGAFDVSFRKKDGLAVYPNNVKVELKGAPICTKDATILNIISEDNPTATPTSYPKASSSPSNPPTSTPSKNPTSCSLNMSYMTITIETDKHVKQDKSKWRVQHRISKKNGGYRYKAVGLYGSLRKERNTTVNYGKCLKLANCYRIQVLEKPKKKSNKGMDGFLHVTFGDKTEEVANWESSKIFVLVGNCNKGIFPFPSV